MKHLAAVSFLLFFASSLFADDAHFKNLGPQITASTLLGTTFGHEGARDVVYTVMRGQPAKLFAIDARTGQLLHTLPLIGADGAWNATTASDGSIYVGTDANGHLYRYIPGESSVHDLGQVLDQTWIWDVAAGKDGEVFASTYPGCRVIRYHPKDGFKDITRGTPASPNEQYARAVAFDPATNKVYVGVGSHAHLVELDPATGDRSEILPKQYANQEFVYGVEIVNHHLFACLTNLNQSLVMDLPSHKIQAVLPEMLGQQVMAHSPVDQKVYYVVNTKLFSFDLAAPAKPPVALTRSAEALAFTWLHYDNDPDFPGQTLVYFTKSQHLVRYNPRTQKTSILACSVPPEPIVIQNIHLGPDGRIWSSGYLSGGNAAYDPTTGKSEQFKGLSQAEGITTLNSSLYFGLYPHANLATYETSKPWDLKQHNPHPIGHFTNQSRPFGCIGVPELNQVFFGTVPEYGQLGGELAIYNPQSDQLQTFPTPIPDQSIISLVYSDHLLVGGTSIYGGLGIDPTQHEGKLFLWDPSTHQKIYETIPIKGALAVTSLTIGPDHNIWGIAAGDLFIFSPTQKKILSTHHLLNADYKGLPIWRGSWLVFHPNGFIYVVLNDTLFSLDPNSFKLTVLHQQDKTIQLALDSAGHLYFSIKTDLWQYTP